MGYLANIAFKTPDGIQEQKKAFSSKAAAVGFCQRNHEKIWSINGHKTTYKLMDENSYIQFLGWKDLKEAAE